MQLRKIGVERYKGYSEPAELELAPLTILVGINNAGKTALAQAIQLIAGGFIPSGKDTPEPLPLQSGGLRHAEQFEDLVTGRTVHGWLRLSAEWAFDSDHLSFSATVRNVVAPPRPSERQVEEWSLGGREHEIKLKRQGFEQGSAYEVSLGNDRRQHSVVWRGLMPGPAGDIPGWVGAQAETLKDWASGVRHLRCPRRLIASPFSTADYSPGVLGPDGEDTPLVLATDDDLRESVREWYRKAFGVSVEVVAQGNYFELVARALARDANVQLVQAGRGLSHVLPVVATILTARTLGAGVDIIEHPEAELHPAAHADIAELLLLNLTGPARPLVIETHSELILLRARRWIAERRLPPDWVSIYWIHAEPGRGSIVQRIGIHEDGRMDGWPDGVFVEDYDEILAIRRAARPKE